MIKIKLDTRGAIADIEKIAAKAQQEVKVALVDFGTKVEAQAKRDAPADEGKLRNSINSVYDNRNTNVKVTVAANYAAYVEFGTRKFAAKYVATLPQQWKDYAATFKGPGGGTFDQFLKAIMAWVKRKGIRPEPKQYEQGDDFSGADGGFRAERKRKRKSRQQEQEELAYAIAIKILIEGIKPQPFFYPAVKRYTPQLEEKLKKIFS